MAEEDLDGTTQRIADNCLKDSADTVSGEATAVVVKLAFSLLINSEAKVLLESPTEDKVSTNPPILPKAGELQVYIYSFLN